MVQHLELVEISDEDAFFDEPPAPELFDVPMDGPKRLWLWGLATLACVVASSVSGFYVGRTRAVPSVVTVIAPAPPQPAPVASVAPVAKIEAREVKPEPKPKVVLPPPPRPAVKPAPRKAPQSAPLTL